VNNSTYPLHVYEKVYNKKGLHWRPFKDYQQTIY
jgi:hypothetical protein